MGERERERKRMRKKCGTESDRRDRDWDREKLNHFKDKLFELLSHILCSWSCIRHVQPESVSQSVQNNMTLLKEVGGPWSKFCSLCDLITDATKYWRCYRTLWKPAALRAWKMFITEKHWHQYAGCVQQLSLSVILYAEGCQRDERGKRSNEVELSSFSGWNDLIAALRKTRSLVLICPLLQGNHNL